MFRVYRNKRKLKDFETHSEATSYCENHARNIITSSYCVDYEIVIVEGDKKISRENYTVIIR